MSEHVEVGYHAKPQTDDDGNLVALRVHRHVSKYPKTARGVSWSKGESEDEPEFIVPVREIGMLTAELVSWLEYWASGEAVKDR